jgi:hypothetical protein
MTKALFKTPPLGLHLNSQTRYHLSVVTFKTNNNYVY